MTVPPKAFRTIHTATFQSHISSSECETKCLRQIWGTEPNSVPTHLRWADQFNYFEIYDRYFEKYKGGAPTILEIGVQHGGSLLMWGAYFGGKASIVGIDILQECKKFERENIRIFIGDQSDERFLNHIIAEVGPVDVIIDDGSHIPKHQIKSFEVLFFNGLKEDGVYICEDCSTSYWPRFGGGVRRAGTFIEYSKRLCDQVNAWVADNPKLIVDDATKWINP